MKVFITGATGYIGNAVATCFSRAGHTVYGLTRSKEKANTLALEEIQPVIGTMDDVTPYSDVLQKCQVMIHCAAEYSKRFMELDRKITDALLMAAGNSHLPRTFIYTSGCWVYGNTSTEPADEGFSLSPPAFIRQRVDNEKIVLGANSSKLQAMVIRPGVVYGKSGGLTRQWFRDAYERGSIRVINEGGNIWSMVHCSDLARLYLKAAESPRGGEIFNAADDSRNTVEQCAIAVSQIVSGSNRYPLENMKLENAAEMFGPLAEGLALSQRLDSSKATRFFNWMPRHNGFIDNIQRYQLSFSATQPGGSQNR